MYIIDETKEQFEKENNNELTQEEINELNDIELEKMSSNIFIDKINKFLSNAPLFCFKTAMFFMKASSIYLLWICLHYFSAHLYVKFCVPYNIMGFIMSPLVIMTPHCQGLRWIVYNAAKIINDMWFLIGAWICSVLWLTNK
jgi:hypothetical protein